MSMTKERAAQLRDFAARQVQSGYYPTEDAILNEYRGKVYAYRLQGSDRTPVNLRLKPETIASWTEHAKAYCMYAVAYFRRTQKEVSA